MPHDDRTGAACRSPDAEDAHKGCPYVTRERFVELIGNDAPDVVGLDDGVEITHKRRA